MVWSVCFAQVIEDNHDCNMHMTPKALQPLTFTCCWPAGISHTLNFEGSPATAACITVHSPALRGSRAGDCSMSATHDTVTFRLDQQQLEVWQALRMPHSHLRCIFSLLLLLSSHVTFEKS